MQSRIKGGKCPELTHISQLYTHAISLNVFLTTAALQNLKFKPLSKGVGWDFQREGHIPYRYRQVVCVTCMRLPQQPATTTGLIASHGLTCCSRHKIALRNIWRKAKAPAQHFRPSCILCKSERGDGQQVTGKSACGDCF